MRKKTAGEDAEEEGQLFFGTGNIFDSSQTEGEPLPSIEVPILAGEEGSELYSRLEALATKHGIGVHLDERLLSEHAMGTYWPLERRIAVRPASPLQQTKT